MTGAPAAFASLSDANGWGPRLTKRLVKSTLPSPSPMGGMRTSFTSDVRILPKAAPMMTPIARSRTLPRMTNFLNSASMSGPPSSARSRQHTRGVEFPPASLQTGQEGAAGRTGAGAPASEATSQKQEPQDGLGLGPQRP